MLLPATPGRSSRRVAFASTARLFLCEWQVRAAYERPDQTLNGLPVIDSNASAYLAAVCWTISAGNAGPGGCLL